MRFFALLNLVNVKNGDESCMYLYRYFFGDVLWICLYNSLAGITIK